MKVKQILAIALVLVWMLAMTGVVGAADTIKIGILGPISNDVGEGEVNAAKMAIEVINKAGGINGKKVELFIEDDENMKKTACAWISLIFLMVVGCSTAPLHSPVSARTVGQGKTEIIATPLLSPRFSVEGESVMILMFRYPVKCRWDFRRQSGENMRSSIIAKRDSRLGPLERYFTLWMPLNRAERPSVLS